MTRVVIAGALVSVFISGSIEAATLNLNLPPFTVADRVSITRRIGEQLKNCREGLREAVLVQ